MFLFQRLKLKGEENERGRLFSSSCVRTGSNSNKLYQGSHSRVTVTDKNITKPQWFCSEIESFGDKHLTFFLCYWNRISFRYFTVLQNLIWKALGNKGGEWQCKSFRQLNVCSKGSSWVKVECFANPFEFFQCLLWNKNIALPHSMIKHLGSRKISAYLRICFVWFWCCMRACTTLGLF